MVLAYESDAVSKNDAFPLQPIRDRADHLERPAERVNLALVADNSHGDLVGPRFERIDESFAERIGHYFVAADERAAGSRVLSGKTRNRTTPTGTFCPTDSGKTAVSVFGRVTMSGLSWIN